MTDKAFDPATTTLEELAAFSRGMRRARWCGVVAGALAALVGLWVHLYILPDSVDWLGLPIIIIAFVGVYRLTYEILKPRR